MFKAGKTYRLVDVKGFLNAYMSNKEIYDIIQEKPFTVTCMSGGDVHKVSVNALEYNLSSLCADITLNAYEYFEEVTTSNEEGKMEKSIKTKSFVKWKKGRKYILKDADLFRDLVSCNKAIADKIEGHVFEIVSINNYGEIKSIYLDTGEFIHITDLNKEWETFFTHSETIYFKKVKENSKQTPEEALLLAPVECWEVGKYYILQDREDFCEDSAFSKMIADMIEDKPFLVMEKDTVGVTKIKVSNGKIITPKDLDKYDHICLLNISERYHFRTVLNYHPDQTETDSQQILEDTQSVMEDASLVEERNWGVIMVNLNFEDSDRLIKDLTLQEAETIAKEKRTELTECFDVYVVKLYSKAVNKVEFETI